MEDGELTNGELTNGEVNYGIYGEVVYGVVTNGDKGVVANMVVVVRVVVVVEKGGESREGKLNVVEEEEEEEEVAKSLLTSQIGVSISTGLIFKTTSMIRGIETIAGDEDQKTATGPPLREAKGSTEEDTRGGETAKAVEPAAGGMLNS